MTEIDTSTTGEFLYSLYHRCWDACQDPDDPYGRKPTHRCYAVVNHPITKVTATRIYFRNPRGTEMERERTYFIEREKFNTERFDGLEGVAYHRGLRELLYLEAPEIPGGNRPQSKSISELRKEMADAHPDRGGNRADFMAARDRYLAAKAMTT